LINKLLIIYLKHIFTSPSGSDTKRGSEADTINTATMFMIALRLKDRLQKAYNKKPQNNCSDLLKLSMFVKTKGAS
jgi:hypothetical protein